MGLRCLRRRWRQPSADGLLNHVSEHDDDFLPIVLLVRQLSTRRDGIRLGMLLRLLSRLQRHIQRLHHVLLRQLVADLRWPLCAQSVQLHRLYRAAADDAADWKLSVPGVLDGQRAGKRTESEGVQFHKHDGHDGRVVRRDLSGEGLCLGGRGV
jgi:hypothetical protein